MYVVTPSLPIVDLPTTMIDPGVLEPLLIVLHATAGRDSRVWLQSNPRGVSVHRLIAKNGTIYKMADDLAICRHVGFSAWHDVGIGGALPNLNRYALGIEIENLNNGADPYMAGQYEMAARQCVEWLGRFGPLPIVGHGEIDTQGKRDPRGWDWLRFWRLVRALMPRVVEGG